MNNRAWGEMENNYLALLANDVKKLWNGLDGGQKLGMLMLIVVTIIAATFFLSKAMEPDWVVLYSDLNEIDSISIVEGMKKNGYKYKVSEDHKSILVPSKVKDDMRVFVAENDLIKNREGGFELLDDMQLGSTDFKNKLTKQRIFQGELTRSIEKIQGIKYARVQLAEPERSIFEDSDEKPTASVVLILEPGYRIKTAQVKAIKNLVAYSVPRLTPEQVFITDQNGNSLSDDTSKNSTDMESFKANLEKDTAKKVSAVLEKIVGKGNVSVQVNADIDFNSAKATIESYKPLNDEKGTGVITSSQTEVETYENPNNLVNNNGVNLTPAVVQNRNLNYSKQKTAINYSVTKEVKQVIYAPGTVKRLSIAVAINKVLTDAEKDEIKNLVLSASGIDYSRGDVVSVSGLQFEGATIDKKQQEDFSEQYRQDQILNFVSTSVIPLLVILILGSFSLLVLKGFISKMPTPKKIEQRPHDNTQEVYQEEIEEVSGGGGDAPRLEINKKEIRSQKDQSINELNEAIMASPEEAAKLLTSFIKN